MLASECMEGADIGVFESRDGYGGGEGMCCSGGGERAVRSCFCVSSCLFSRSGVSWLSVACGNCEWFGESNVEGKRR